MLPKPGPHGGATSPTHLASAPGTPAPYKEVCSHDRLLSSPPPQKAQDV